jgi:DNA replication protein DnaC
MNTQLTLDQLRSMKLHGMADAYQAMLNLPVHEQPSPDLLIGAMVDGELNHRREQTTRRHLQRSKIRYPAMLEQIHCGTDRNLSRQQLLSLADCRFIDRGENVLITGATGCGKSYLASALGRQACSLGYSVLYLGMNRLMEQLTQAKLDGTYMKWLNKLEKTRLLIIDDFGLQELDAITRLALLQILEDRYGKQAIIITAQLPVGKWHDIIAEPTVADSILDRLLSNAHRLELKGPSLRRKEAKNM